MAKSKNVEGLAFREWMDAVLADCGTTASITLTYQVLRGRGFCDTRVMSAHVCSENCPHTVERKVSKMARKVASRVAVETAEDFKVKVSISGGGFHFVVESPGGIIESQVARLDPEEEVAG